MESERIDIDTAPNGTPIGHGLRVSVHKKTGIRTLADMAFGRAKVEQGSIVWNAIRHMLLRSDKKELKQNEAFLREDYDNTLERVAELRERLKQEQQDAYERQKDSWNHIAGNETNMEHQWCEGRIQGFNSALDAINELFPVPQEGEL